MPADLVTVPTVTQNSLHPLSTSCITACRLYGAEKDNSGRRTENPTWTSVAPTSINPYFYAKHRFCRNSTNLSRLVTNTQSKHNTVTMSCSNQLVTEQIVSVMKINTHTQPFNGPLSRTTQVSRYQKGKTNLDFNEARDSEWQWHQVGRMQICTSLQTDNHASTPPLKFFTGWMPFLPPNQQRQSTEGKIEYKQN